MLRLARSVISIIAALALMGALAAGAFVLATTTPAIAPGWYYFGAAIIYSMIVLLVLDRGAGRRA